MVVLPFVHPGDEVGVQSAAWVPVHLLYFGALAVTLLVLVGTFARQLQQAGRLGVAAFPVAFFGAGILLAVGGPIVAFSPPIGILAVPVVGYALSGSGLAWLGYALWHGA
jgi:hypothetical protein